MMKSIFFRLSMVLVLLALLMPTTGKATSPAAVAAADAEVYIIVFEAPALPMYTGGMPGLNATSIQSTGATRLDVNSPASVAYRTYLRNQQTLFVERLAKTVGHPLDVLHMYQLSINGMAVKLSPAEVETVKQMEGVKDVVPNWYEYPQTDAGPGWVGAEGVWDGSATGVGTMGEGMVIAVLDTGINRDHPSFADVGDDGYNHTNPREKYYGWCDPDDENYIPDLGCNDKLIGLWSADEDLPEDHDGHGTHVAGTIVGNVLTATLHGRDTTNITRTISGVAPHANLIVYDIEAEQGGGETSGYLVLAATEQLIEDQPDVANYSFGSGFDDPWLVAQHWLNVRAAGIFVATSAGDRGARSGSVNAPATAPWILSVANATHNRSIPNSLVDMEGGENPPDDIVGRGVTQGHGPAPIVYSGWYSDVFTQPVGSYTPEEVASMCLEPFPESTFDGEIVVCDRGEIPRTEKGYNVHLGGAGGYVLVNDEEYGADLMNDSHYLPATHITYEDGLILKDWLTNTVVQTATITGIEIDVDDAYGDVVAPYSSRGPNVIENILKPNVAAPGTEILAANMTDQSHPTTYAEYDFKSGTSMASPHAAGVAALVLKLHPSWTPAQVQSAIESTAINAEGFLKEDGVTPADPFDIGAGRVYAATAAKAGLLLDVPVEDFTAADPFNGVDPSTLNLVGLAQDKCVYNCSWTRTLQSPLDYAETWTAEITAPLNVNVTVVPPSFELAPGETQVITVTADVQNADMGEWMFGAVRFTPATTDTVPARFPMAFKYEFSTVPDRVNIETMDLQGTQVVSGFKVAQPVTGLTAHYFGLTQATLTQEDLDRNPTPGEFDVVHNPEMGIMVVSVTVTGTYQRVVAEIVNTTSPNLNLYIYREGADEPLCSSDFVGSMEYCSKVVSSDTYNIVIENYGVGEPATLEVWDRVIVAYAVVADGPMDNMLINGPPSGSVPVGTEFDIDINWDLEPEERPEETDIINRLHFYKFYGAFELGSSPTQSDNIGYVPVDLTLELYRYIYLPLIVRTYNSP